MAVPFSNTKLRVPKGFQNILEGLTREILRSQPENPFEFGAKYFEQLLRVREETGHDPAIHGARLEDRYYNNDSFKSPSVDPGSPQQQDAALTIQTNYRKHTAEKDVAKLREDEAAEKIQAGFRGYQDRQKFSEIKSRKEHGEQPSETPEDEGEPSKDDDDADIDLNDPEVEKAAVKIQAGFKGFKARQEIKEMKGKAPAKAPSPTPSPPPSRGKDNDIDIDLDDPEVNAAALKIQSGFRGHKSRQQVKEMRQSANQDTPKRQPSPTLTPPPAKGIDNDIDIDLTDPEVNAAALKIQAGFRGHQSRQQVKEMKAQKGGSAKTDSAKSNESIDLDLNDPELSNAALKIQTSFRGHVARKEVEAMKEARNSATTDRSNKDDIDIDLDDPETEKAALKIQAGFKGYQTRKEIKAKRETQEATKADFNKPEPDGKNIDIDMDDPEVVEAATKIQAGFKGFKTRQELKAKAAASKDEESQGNKGDMDANVEGDVEAEGEGENQAENEGEKPDEVDIDLNDPEVQMAATKIQAGFKGFKTRKELKEKKSQAKADDD
ncbi:uncharacterized protein LOC127880669 isoform X2 [Dreissena polymorpha]|uniref:uncharacterized protein LOC127880669 isoform X2 n=1 Tax=Dreissena polymorpha TaxID=45954 RepID=UPI002264090B|nr:uncharacterized protein LOC127880669 isoform X2 [Dreissena polymorpha]